MIEGSSYWQEKYKVHKDIFFYHQQRLEGIVRDGPKSFSADYEPLVCQAWLEVAVAQQHWQCVQVLLNLLKFELNDKLNIRENLALYYLTARKI